MMRALSKQRGMGTLIFSVLVMAAVLMMVLYTTKVIVIDTKIASNEVRSRRAFEAAEAGINAALAAYGNGRRPTYTENGEVYYPGGVFGDETSPVGASDNATSFTLTDDAGNEVAFVEVTVATSGEVQSRGWSDDRAISKLIVSQIQGAEGMSNVPENPFTARGVVSISGSATVYNQEGASTIWSGGSVNNAKGESYIADPAGSTYPSCMDISMYCSVVQASDEGVGVDVVSNDSTIANLSEEEFFQNFFGMSMDDYKKSVVSLLTTGVPPDGTNGEVVWVDGDMTLNGGVYGCDLSNVSPSKLTNVTYPLTGKKSRCEATTNAILKPVILIVDGTLTVQGNPHIFGVLMVLGDIEGAGTVDVTGATIITGTAGDTGNFNIVYNSKVLQMAGDDSPAHSVVAGGWRDFGN